MLGGLKLVRNQRSASGPKLALTDAEGGAGVGSSGVRLDLGLAHGANDATRQSLDLVLRFAGGCLGHQLYDLVGFGIAGRLSQRDQLTDPECVRYDGATYWSRDGIAPAVRARPGLLQVRRSSG